ncbi:hypothetical protein D9Q98_002065 [Chlorella vulgaris]|uniref:Fe2OG dioxygenase domain-containing protein n=1 Tax=Chlorella vulgaris TaxID=3077 RepID=A0A9D4TVP5_CHLVU|nr:hypothetical protein D9Q98_002065 [Chlorella vulgaris]
MTTDPQPSGNGAHHASPGEPPVIDAQQLLAPANASAPPPPEVASAIADAASTIGFFQLTNHGMDAAVLQRMTRAMHSFFDLDLETKLQARRSETNAMGYAHDELTKQTLDLKEVFDVSRVPHPELPDTDPLNKTIEGFNLWPPGQDEFRAAVLAYYREVERCSFQLLEAFCAGLGMERTALHHLFEGQHTGFLRLNHYPLAHPLAQQAGKPQELMGVHHHTDAGFLTILVQDEVAGLEALAADGTWHLVRPIDGALTINVGDLAQVLSNDRFKAPLHRVRASRERRRYSAPFFFNPRPDADIAPLPQFVDDMHPPVYRPINWGQFRSKRYEGDYADKGEEVQISHYRLDRIGSKEQRQQQQQVAT